jgi:hypothetical protein
MSVEAAAWVDHVVIQEDEVAMQRTQFRLPLDHIVQLNDRAFAAGATRISDMLHQALDEFFDEDDDTRQSYMLQTNDADDGTEWDVTAEIKSVHLAAMGEAVERLGLAPSVPIRAAVRYFLQAKLLESIRQ